MFSTVTNMESQATTANQSASASQPGRFAVVILPALVRLALLVVPLMLAVIFFSHTPVLCAILFVGILTLWLTVDVGPFRVNKATPARQPRASALPTLRNLTQPQWWSGLFCRAAIVGAIFYSKLHI